MSGTAHEVLPGPSGEGTVLVEIGVERGALVVVTGEARNGCEIEIRGAGTSWAGEHVAVRERRIRSGAMYAALFPSLPQGRYDLRLRPHGPAVLDGITVTAGEVTHVIDPTT